MTTSSKIKNQRIIAGAFFTPGHLRKPLKIVIRDDIKAVIEVGDRLLSLAQIGAGLFQLGAPADQ